jgi:hypothetical protein
VEAYGTGNAVERAFTPFFVKRRGEGWEEEHSGGERGIGGKDVGKRMRGYRKGGGRGRWNRIGWG